MKHSYMSSQHINPFNINKSRDILWMFRNPFTVVLLDLPITNNKPICSDYTCDFVPCLFQGASTER